MASGDIKILDKLYINQNLICLIVSFIFIAYSRHWCCCGCKLMFPILRIFLMLFFIASVISVIVSIYIYTVQYYRKKSYQGKCYKMRYYYIREQIDKKTVKDANGEKIIGW